MILGDANQIYYDDRNPNTQGETDFALIEDFDPQQDQIQLQGDRSLYDLSFFTDGRGNLLANIFYVPSGAIPERVGIIKNVSSQLTLDNSGFVFVQPKQDNKPDNPQTIIGTPSQDNLVGGSGNDRISGDSGQDTIRGNNGNDLLNGGSQRDSLFGGQGSDTLNGDDNGDTLFGGDNNDLLHGNNNQDRLFGESGNDRLFGGGDNDRLNGGTGNDTLNGSEPKNSGVQFGEQDTLVGGAGSDLLILGDANQIYYDDRNPNTQGETDFALIEDFDPQQDQIQLQGDRSLYNLSFYTDGQGSLMANIFYQQPGSESERVGIIDNVSPELTIDDSAFTFI